MSRAPTTVEITEWAQRLYRAARALSDEFQSTKAGDSYRYVGGMNPVDDLREVLEEACAPDSPISLAIYGPDNGDDFGGDNDDA